MTRISRIIYQIPIRVIGVIRGEKLVDSPFEHCCAGWISTAGNIWRRLKAGMVSTADDTDFTDFRRL
jgi:hypothetical protein